MGCSQMGEGGEGRLGGGGGRGGTIHYYTIIKFNMADLTDFKNIR